MTFGESVMADAGVGSTGSGPWLPMVDSHLPDGIAYGADGAWQTHVPYANDYANGYHPNGFGAAHYQHQRKEQRSKTWKEKLAYVFGFEKRGSETFHQKSRRLIRAANDSYDVLVSVVPTIYAASLLGVSIWGAIDIAFGKIAEGTAKLGLGAGTFIYTTEKVRAWADRQLDRKKVKRLRSLPREEKVRIVEEEFGKGEEDVVGVIGNDRYSEGVLNTIIEKAALDDGLFCGE